jgi:epoxide hydrolase-like predicted phosphatase
MNDTSLFSSIDNLIFDLGGVLYGVDYVAVEQALTALQDSTASDVPVYSRFIQPDCVTLYETGRISAQEFRDAMRHAFAIRADDETLDRAWCAILTGTYEGRVQLLQQLRSQYRIVLLSNTNEIHLQAVRRECPELLDVFEQCFYSHEMKLRKPETAIFEQVVETMGFVPERTLFLDDSPQHLQAAEALGIHTVWVQHPEVVELVASLLMEAKKDDVFSNEPSSRE